MLVPKPRVQGWLQKCARAGMGVGFTAAAVAVVLGLEVIFHRPFPAFLIVSVMLSAWLGGVSSGLLATLLSAFAINYFVQSPRFALGISSAGDMVQSVLFMVAGLTVSYLARTRQETRDELDEHAQALEVMRERERIAMDLHDGMIQSLYAVTLKLASARRQLPVDEQAARTALFGAGQAIMGEIEGVRAYIASLRSSSAGLLDLKSALEGLAEQARTQTSAHVSVEIEEDAVYAIDSGQLGEVLHIAREALSNAIRHARAADIDMILARSGHSVVVTVHDTGRGFNPDLQAERGEGLRNMRERASRLGARLTVRSRPSGGTTIVLSLPAQGDQLPAEVA